MAFLEILQQAFIQQLSQAQEVAFIQQASVLRQWVQHGTTWYNTLQHSTVLYKTQHPWNQPFLYIEEDH